MLLLIFVGVFRPYLSNWENILDMLNEFTILLLYSHLITQTDFVIDIAGCYIMGWSLICVICLNIGVNLGNILVRDIWALCRKLKLYYLKKAFLKKKLLQQEKQKFINQYRKD